MKKKDKNLSMALNIAAIAVGMLCVAYAAVPLYSLFCKVTGFAGTPQVAVVAPDKVYDRVITVRFNADVAPDLPWKFKPEQKQVKVKVGEQKLIFYSAKNESNDVTRGISVYNVTPEKAGAYFSKIECFCFTEQSLNANEKANFPVSFFIDPQIMSDKNAKDINTITLSYTFFKVKES